ncbi:MAG: RHS repeat domain-containing protein [Bryobacterales bacterium]
MYQLTAAMSFTYRNSGRFQTINGANATYDARGNLTSLPTANGTATLRYDADGNLVSGPGVTYEYDAEDRLIAWTSSGGRTRFTVNLYRASTRCSSSAPQVRRAVIRWRRSLYEETSSGGIRVFSTTIQRGSSIAFFQDNGAAVGTVAYGPYGEVIGQSGNSDSIFLFCGLYASSPTRPVSTKTSPLVLGGLKRFLTPDLHYGTIDRMPLNRYVRGNNLINLVTSIHEESFLPSSSISSSARS